MQNKRWIWLVTALLSFFNAQCAYSLDPIDSRFAQYIQVSKLHIDHTFWNQFLNTYVKVARGDHYVDYGKIDKATVQELKKYLERLQAVDIPSYSQQEQLAFWINLYNAQTVLLILERYPVSSIRDISEIALFSGNTDTGPWKRKLLKVSGVSLSLADIEEGILRPVWRDPRILYLIPKACMGCPDMPVRAANPEQLEEQLNKAATRYINSQKGVVIENKKLLIANLYETNRSDFGGFDESVLAHIRQFADAPLLENLKPFTHYGYLKADWKLNDYARYEQSRSLD